MDYPQLNLLFGLILIFTVVLDISLGVLLSRIGLPTWMSFLSWLGLIVSVLPALYIEFLFVRLMTPAFNLQILIGWLVIGGAGALITASLYRRDMSARLAGILFVVQILVSIVSVILAFGLYRSLVPILRL